MKYFILLGVLFLLVFSFGCQKLTEEEQAKRDEQIKMIMILDSLEKSSTKDQNFNQNTGN